MTQIVSSKSIQSLAASKLIGALPAVSGAALTNVSAGVYNNTSDPAVNSNRDLGTLWANSVSGNLFLCINATTDNNIWENIGGGSYNIATAAFGGNGPGSVSGYNAGAEGPGANIIAKYSYTSNANATDHGDLTQNSLGPAGVSSSTHGYACGGSDTPSRFKIDKFTFGSNSNASNIGTLKVYRIHPSGQSSTTHGYVTGGNDTTKQIDRFNFASDGDSINLGDMYKVENGGGAAGHSSNSNGYMAGGTAGSTIQKFSFWGDSASTNVGNMTIARQYCAAHSSTTHGYTSGGYSPDRLNNIDKFSFSSDGNATDVGNLTIGRSHLTGSSSTASGYTCGGHNGSASQNVIDKFSFSSDGNSTDVGDLTQLGYQSAGMQV